MDKRTVYGRITEGKIRCLTDRQCREPQCRDCTEFVLVDPAALAEVEVKAALFDALTTEVSKGEPVLLELSPYGTYRCYIGQTPHGEGKTPLESLTNALAKGGK